MNTKYTRYEDIPSVQEPINNGDVDCVFVSDGFWFGRCTDDGCANLHLFLHEKGRRYEVAATFNCEQLENMLDTARLIRQRRKN